MEKLQAMKQLILFIFSALVMSACDNGSKKAEPAQGGVTKEKASVSKPEEDNSAAVFLGSWKLFKKEDKNNKVMSTDDHQFLEFTNDSMVEIKTTGLNTLGNWYIVSGSDASKKPIRYLVIETKTDNPKWSHESKKFLKLKSIEQKNLILTDEGNRTFYYQKY